MRPAQPAALHQRFTPALNPTRIALAAAIAVALAASHAPLVHAQSGTPATAATPIPINIQAQPLGQALNELARQANLQMTFPPSLVAGKQTSFVSGKLTVTNALEQLLAGSGLTAKVSGSNVTVQPAIATSNDESALPTVLVTAPSERYPEVRKPEATRTAATAQEMGKSVQQYGEEIIKDVQPASIADIVTLAPNVSNLGTNDGRENNFTIRGFQSNYGANGLVVDGFRFRRNIANPEIFNIEQIEVLKGSDSVLYGANEAGGLVALSNKRPTTENHTKLEIDATSFGGVTPKFDLNRLAGADGALAFRVLGLVSNDPGWRNFNTNARRVFLAPSLTAKLGSRTELTTFLEYTKDRKPNDMGTAITQEGQPAGNVKTINSHPDEVFRADQTTVGIDLRHQLREQWTVHARARHQENSYDFGNIWIPFAYAAPSILRVPATQTLESTERNVQLTLRGDLNWGNVRHRVTAGVDHSKAREKSSGCVDFTTVSALDLNNPAYSPLLAACDTTLLPNSFQFILPIPETIKRTGFYLMDTITPVAGLNVTLGLRHERHQQTTDGSTSGPVSDASVTMPQLGVNYSVTPNVSIYGSFAESFTPSTARNSQSQLLPSEQGRGVELGVKTNVLNNKLQATFAIFKVKKVNVAIPDPNNSLFSIASGAQESQGVEIELKGSLNRSIDMVASLGTLDTKDKSSNAGMALINAPEVTGNLWLNYKLTPNWSLSAGIKHVASRFATADNTVKLPAYTLLNLGGEYTTGRWTSRLAVQNLTDKTYIESAAGGVERSVYAGTPRKVVLTTRYEF